MAGGFCNRCNQYYLSPVKCDKYGCENEEYHREMEKRYPGEWPKKVYISIIGGRNAGKTYYLLSLIDVLLQWKNIRVLMNSYGITKIEMIDPISKRLVKRLQQEGSHARLQSTDQYIPLGFFSLILTLANNKSYEIVLFNSSGEHIETEFQKQLIQTDSHDLLGSAVMYFVDPREDSGLNALLDLPKKEGTCNDYEMGSHIYNVFSWLDRDSGIVSTPLAVCISKFDLLLHQRPNPVPQHPFVEADDPNFSDRIKRVSRELRVLLRDHSKTLDVADIDEKFEKVNYFAVAPFGSHEEPKWQNRKPKGLLAPFIWMLTQLTIINEKYATSQ